MLTEHVFIIKATGRVAVANLVFPCNWSVGWRADIISVDKILLVDYSPEIGEIIFIVPQGEISCAAIVRKETTASTIKTNFKQVQGNGKFLPLTNMEKQMTIFKNVQ